MCHRAAIVALILQAVLRAVPQPPQASPEPVVLKSTSHAVQLDVFVNDPSGRPVHGLQKNDFAVTDNGHPRDIRIFAGEIDANQTAPSSGAMALPAGVYSNRFSLRDSRIVTAIVIDAVPRAYGLQKNSGIFAKSTPDYWFDSVRWQAINAVDRMEPGQMIAVYAACPDLRVVQDYTSDPDRLIASLKAFVPPSLRDSAGQKQPWTIDALVPPMLSVLRDVAGRMAGASGRKSVVWISQAYGTELNLSAIGGATDSTVAAFNDANVPLYAVDPRFSPTCQTPAEPAPGRIESGIDYLTCFQPPDISDKWMEYLARATGGRAFSGGNVVATRWRDAQGQTSLTRYELHSDHGIVSDAIRFAVDDSRYAYEMGFYVPEAELDGKVHKLGVTVPAKPKFGLLYRSGYTASVSATAPPPASGLTGSDSNGQPSSSISPDEMGIDAKLDVGAKNTESRISLAFAPETVTRSADGVIVLDATFTQTDDSGKQLAKIEETIRVPSPENQADMVPTSAP